MAAEQVRYVLVHFLVAAVGIITLRHYFLWCVLYCYCVLGTRFLPDVYSVVDKEK